MSNADNAEQLSVVTLKKCELNELKPAIHLTKRYII